MRGGRVGTNERDGAARRRRRCGVVRERDREGGGEERRRRSPRGRDGVEADGGWRVWGRCVWTSDIFLR